MDGPLTAVAGGSGLVALAIAFFLLVLAILWFLLPFAVFGVKDRLDRLIRTQEQTNKLLAQLAQADTPHIEIGAATPSKPYPHSFKYRGRTIFHDNISYMVGGQVFDSADAAKTHVDGQ